MKNIFETTTCLQEEEIKRYLSEQSPKEELRRVEDHLLDCPFCADAVEGFQAHYNFDEQVELENIKKDLLSRNSAAKEAPKVVPMHARNRMFTLNRIAAAILLFLIPAAGWMYWNNSTDGNLVNNFGMIETLRSDTEDVTDPALLKAIELIDAEQYEAALGATQKILSVHKEDVQTTFYAGISALKATQYELAEHYFMTLRLNSDYYFEDASWLMVQACLGANKKEKAMLLLEEILLNPDGLHYDSAKKLKETLD